MFFNRPSAELAQPTERFLVTVEKETNCVRATCPDFPSCVVEALTVEAALDELRKMILSHLDAIREDLAEITGFE